MLDDVATVSPKRTKHHCVTIEKHRGRNPFAELARNEAALSRIGAAAGFTVEETKSVVEVLAILDDWDAEDRERKRIAGGPPATVNVAHGSSEDISSPGR